MSGTIAVRLNDHPLISTIRYMNTTMASASAALLRDARRQSGLPQAALAARAGVAQSVISAYESGHRQPALSTLLMLLDAAGFELDLQLRRLPRRLETLTGPIGRRLRQRRPALLAAAHAHGVRNLRVFGTVARGQDRPDSDLELLADLPSELGLFELGEVRAEFAALLGVPVDLVSPNDLEPDVRQPALREAIALGPS